MKKEIGRGDKIVLMIFVSVFVVIMVTSMVSAGFFENIRGKITGKATNPQILNATVGVPEIRWVDNDTITDLTSGPNQGPLHTSVIINFSVFLASGANNLDNSTASINFSLTGSDLRQNTSCFNILTDGGNNANYSCNVTMWWWDANGTWTINAFIADTNGNNDTNETTTFTMGSTTGFDMGPTTLTWPGLSPGSKNQTSNNDPLVLNNTGNRHIPVGNISINSTDLRGESNGDFAIWAGNITINVSTGGSPPADCALENVRSHGAFTNITLANLSAENYTLNNGVQAQEELYFCFIVVGSELTAQSYSTANQSTWTVRVLV